MSVIILHFLHINLNQLPATLKYIFNNLITEMRNIVLLDQYSFTLLLLLLLLFTW
jgi:hypothetical protein